MTIADFVRVMHRPGKSAWSLDIAIATLERFEQLAKRKDRGAVTVPHKHAMSLAGRKAVGFYIDDIQGDTMQDTSTDPTMPMSDTPLQRALEAVRNGQTDVAAELLEGLVAEERDMRARQQRQVGKMIASRVLPTAPAPRNRGERRRARARGKKKGKR